MFKKKLFGKNKTESSPKTEETFTPAPVVDGLDISHLIKENYVLAEMEELTTSILKNAKLKAAQSQSDVNEIINEVLSRYRAGE
jgi:hypothetical protein